MSDYGFFNDGPVAERDDSADREVERLQAELAAVRAERDALAADWDALAVALGQYADEDNWIQYDGMGLRYIWVGRGEGMDIASEAIAAAWKERERR